MPTSTRAQRRNCTTSCWNSTAYIRPAWTEAFMATSSSSFFSPVTLAAPSTSTVTRRSCCVTSRVAFFSLSSPCSLRPKVCMALSTGPTEAASAWAMADQRWVSGSSVSVTVDFRTSIPLSAAALTFPMSSSSYSLAFSTSSWAFSLSITSVELMIEVIPARAAMSRAFETEPGTIFPVMSPSLPRGFHSGLPSTRLAGGFESPAAPWWWSPAWSFFLPCRAPASRSGCARSARNCRSSKLSGPSSCTSLQTPPSAVVQVAASAAVDE
mmetsp:Transcript_7182/g.22981  ORF Transcript_7182/g.22981 Transcript_7182/m.22981 type:complete len:268 (-) Transcript_7182:108-911(-)